MALTKMALTITESFVFCRQQKTYYDVLQFPHAYFQYKLL